MSHKSRIEKLEEQNGITDTQTAARLFEWWESLGKIETQERAANATDYRIIELLETAQARRFLATQKPSEILTRVEALMAGREIPEDMQQQIESLRQVNNEQP